MLTWFFRLLGCLVLVAALFGCGGGSSSTSKTTDTSTGINDDKVVLSVSVFGEGAIVPDVGTLSCKNQYCEGVFDKGAVVTLSAKPGAQWVSDHWSGCSSVLSNKCQVKLEGNTQVHQYFGKTTPPVVNKSVVQLTADTMGKLVSRAGNVFTFQGTATQLQTVVRGNIIVSTQSNGFAQRVLNIYGLNAGNIVIEAEPVGLDEIIDDGVMLFQSKAASPSGMKLAQGVSHQLIPMSDGVTSSFTLDVPLGKGGSLKGGLDVVWNFEGALDFGLLTGLKEAKLMANPNITPNLTVAFEKDLPLYEKRFSLGIVTITPIIMGPIVIVPTVEGYVKIDAKGSAQVEFVSNYSVQTSLGIHYVKGIGWNGVGQAAMSGSFSPKAAAEIEGKAGVGVYTAFFVYDLIGPFIQIGPYVKAKGQFEPVVSPTMCVRATVDLGLSAEAGGEFNVLGKSIGKWEGTVFDKVLANIYQYPKAGSTNTVCEDAEKPDAPVVSIGATTYSSIGLKWDQAKDNIGVVRYDVYRDGVNVSKTDLFAYTDSNLQGDKGYCYQVIAVDQAGNRSAPSAQVCAKTLKNDTTGPTTPNNLFASASSTTSMNLSWSASTDESGVAKYLIVLDDGLQVLETSGLTYEVLKLKSSTRYCFKVYAFDKAGNKSAASDKVCAQTLDSVKAAWTMKLGCQGSDWLITKGVDLTLDQNFDLSVTDSANDYNGTPMVYHLYGSYLQNSKALNAKIQWTFEGSSNVRLDQFSADFSGTDTGDVNMTQVQVTGCDAKVRFIRNPSGQAKPMFESFSSKFRLLSNNLYYDMK